MTLSADRIPVIVGVGETLDRPASPAQGAEPLALMIEALRRAEQDAAPGLLALTDSLDVVCEYSWPYVDAPGLVASALDLPPGHRHYGETGGESPVRFIHEAALRIQRGECRAAAVVGAESAHTTAAAWKTGLQLPWPHRDAKARLLTGAELVAPVAIDHGVAVPAFIYPFFETAAVAAWGQTQREGLQESGQIWSRFSEVASTQEYAWLKERHSPEAVVTPTAENRLIAWPYTKRVVANPLVNMGAAVLLTSLQQARELGISEDRLIHLWTGAAASEPRDYLQRDRYTHAPAQTAVLQACVEAVPGGAQALEAVELYSCFPCVPKMARRAIGLGLEQPLSVTGGLSFFGAPLNSYMTHAACAMVRALRAGGGGPGLLYGQGEFVTKHHALVLSRQPAAAPLAPDYSVQARADAARGPVPSLVLDYAGPATLESFTLIYERDPQPAFGTVIARTPQGGRLMARVPREDAATLAALMDLDSQPVGRAGQVSRLDPKRLRWTLA